MADSRPSSASRTNRSPKQSSSQAALNEKHDKPHRPTKRRASKACQCCRSRKVRCNVVEHGPPCTNCRLDEVECVITESKRKRKALPKIEVEQNRGGAGASGHRTQAADRILDGIPSLDTLAKRSLLQQSNSSSHVPHSLYRSHSDKPAQVELRRPSMPSSNSAPGHVHRLAANSMMPNLTASSGSHASVQMLPFYLKPVPSRMGNDEVDYLDRKAAFTIPTYGLRDELCRAYIEFVHPYMPLINIHDFLRIIQQGDGSDGKISLLLFQAIMFAGSAFVSLNSLKRAGFNSRKDARKVFFKRVRLLYDFDYENDRFSQVQALLLMTSWYETSDDKKDAWHWMGIAIATSYTIGLHRNPAIFNMDSEQQKIWKRVWWACVIRDRLIALGARRPIRIKPEDFDVPVLTIEDFDIGVMPDSITCIPRDCTIIRDVQMQTSMAIMAIEKSKLSMRISDILDSQYSIQKQPVATGGFDVRTAAVLSPKPIDQDPSGVMALHQQLEDWRSQLPDSLQWNEPISTDTKISRGDASYVVQRALLHLIYFATLSALHRPQVLHGHRGRSEEEKTDSVSEFSRDNLRQAALETSHIAKTLLDMDVVQYLPTTGVTVLQPAIISHLLDIKSNNEQIRRTALQGFCQCIDVMGKLRDCYTAADHSIALVEAAIRRADIRIPVQASSSSDGDSATSTSETPADRKAENAEDLVDVGKREHLIPSLPSASQGSDSASEDESPDPEDESMFGQTSLSVPAPTDYEIARKLEVFLASTPLESEPQTVPGMDYLTCVPVGHYTYDNDFDAFVDFSGADPSTEDDQDMAFSLNGLDTFTPGASSGATQMHHAQFVENTMDTTPPDWTAFKMDPSVMPAYSDSQDMKVAFSSGPMPTDISLPNQRVRGTGPAPTSGGTIDSSPKVGHPANRRVLV